MGTAENEAEAVLSARISDLCRAAERGEVAETHFLTPTECALADIILRENGYRKNAVFFGGVADAERKKLFILPDYYTWDGEEDEVLSDLFFGSVTAFRVAGSGFRVLFHRDYLGSLLGLGLERFAVGDIFTEDDCHAVFFCESVVSDFIMQNLKKVASDSVRVTATDPKTVCSKREFKALHDTVASPRADCVVASLCNLSRDKAQSLIVSGNVLCNYLPLCDADRRLANGDILTVHGVGKFRLVKLSELTKKGRLRLEAEQYQ